MSVQYVAKANVVKVSVGPATGNRVARFVRAGGLIPEGVEEASLKALEARGLIAPVPLVVATEAAPSAEEVAAAATAQEAADKAAAKAGADAAKKAAAAKAADK